jgi:hypothetical protein
MNTANPRPGHEFPGYSDARWGVWETSNEDRNDTDRDGAARISKTIAGVFVLVQVGLLGYMLYIGLLSKMF